jgi:hypothetical protein
MLNVSDQRERTPPHAPQAQLPRTASPRVAGAIASDGQSACGQHPHGAAGTRMTP